MRLTFGLILLLSCPSVWRAQDHAAPLRQDFPTLFQRFNEGADPFDYVIVIDRSRSMKRYWDQVRAGLIEFVNVLREGDHISIIFFGNSASDKKISSSSNGCLKHLAIPGKLINSARIRADVVQEIQSLCNPDGDDTDIGEALEKALTELNRPGGHRLKIVFFFTDFKHQPGSNSRYANKFLATEDVWQQLAARKRNELADKTVLSYAMLLNTGRDTGQDIKLAQTVFPELEQLPVNGPSLQAYFTRIKSELLRSRLKAAVTEATSLTQPVVKNIYQHENQLIASIEIPPNPLLTTKSLSRVQVSDIKVDGLTSHLTPIVTGDQEYPIDQTSRQVEIPIATVKTDDLISWQITAPFSFTLRAKQNLSSASEITKLNLPASIDREIVSAAISVSSSGGRLSYLACTGILLFIGIVMIVLHRRFRRDFILGVFTISNPNKEVIGLQRFTKKDKRTEFAIGDGGMTISHGCRIPGADWKLLFYAVTPGLLGQRGTYLEVKKGMAKLMINGREERLRPGDPAKLISNKVFVTAGEHSVEFIVR